jgi:hypothetical protein
MNFNFYEDFKSHSNEELIAIIRQTDAYQPEAVAAAYQHLNEREVSENEILGKSETREITHSTFVAEESQEDLLVPYIQQDVPIIYNKWINILLSFIAFRFLAVGGGTLWYFYKLRMRLFYVFSLDFMLIFIGLPIIFLLIFQRKKWGWFLFLSFSIFNLFGFIVNQVVRLAYGYIPHLAGLLVPLVYASLSGISIFVLCKKEVASLYHVSKSEKPKTALIAVILSVLVFAVARYF